MPRYEFRPDGSIVLAVETPALRSSRLPLLAFDHFRLRSTCEVPIVPATAGSAMGKSALRGFYGALRSTAHLNRQFSPNVYHVKATPELAAQPALIGDEALVVPVDQSSIMYADLQADITQASQAVGFEVVNPLLHFVLATRKFSDRHSATHETLPTVDEIMDSRPEPYMEGWQAA